MYVYFLFKDGTLSCTMNGHKSVVSTLAVCNEVLYSGSWDGTIRLWSLIDHSPLTVLGEDTSGTVTSILALAVDRHMLIAAQENGCVKVLYSLNLELNLFLCLLSCCPSQKVQFIENGSNYVDQVNNTVNAPPHLMHRLVQ